MMTSTYIILWKSTHLTIPANSTEIIIVTQITWVVIKLKLKLYMDRLARRGKKWNEFKLFWIKLIFSSLSYHKQITRDLPWNSITHTTIYPKLGCGWHGIMLLLLLALIHPILRIVKLFRTTSSLSVHRGPSFVHPQLTTMFYCKLLLLFSFSALTQLYFSTNIIVSWSSKTQETTKNILVLSVMYPCFWIASFAGTLPDCETIRVAMKKEKRVGRKWNFCQSCTKTSNM